MIDEHKPLVDELRGVLPWLSTLALSTAATAAQYAERVRSGEPFKWSSLLLDAVICIFVGLLTHMICHAAGIENMWRSVLVAISAHMGTRAMRLYVLVFVGVIFAAVVEFFGSLRAKNRSEKNAAD